MWQKNPLNNRKICPECGKAYPPEDNFCPKHFKLIKLIDERDLVKICPKCHRR